MNPFAFSNRRLVRSMIKPLLLIFVVMLFLECSHTKPYIRADVRQFKEHCSCGEPCETDSETPRGRATGSFTLKPVQTYVAIRWVDYLAFIRQSVVWLLGLG